MVAALVDYPRDARLESHRRRRPASSRKARLELYRRRRLAAAAVVLIGLALLIMVSTLAVQAALGRTGGGPLTATGALPGGQLAGSDVYVVRPGDTIWSIARSVDPRGDVRPLVDKISSQLGGTNLYPGERLTLSLNR